MQAEVGKTWWFFSRRCKGSRYPEGCKKKQEAAIPNLDDVVTGFNLWCCDGTASTSTLKSRLDKGNFRRVSGNFCHVSTRILYREVNAEDAHLGLLTVANITVGGLLYWLKFAYFWCYYNANFVGVCVWHVRLEVNVFLLFWSSAHCRLKNIINAIPSSVSQSKVKHSCMRTRLSMIRIDSDLARTVKLPYCSFCSSYVMLTLLNLTILRIYVGKRFAQKQNVGNNLSKW